MLGRCWEANLKHAVAGIWRKGPPGCRRCPRRGPRARGSRASVAPYARAVLKCGAKPRPWPGCALRPLTTRCHCTPRYYSSTAVLVPVTRRCHFGELQLVVRARARVLRLRRGAARLRSPRGSTRARPRLHDSPNGRVHRPSRALHRIGVVVLSYCAGCGRMRVCCLPPPACRGRRLVALLQTGWHPGSREGARLSDLVWGRIKDRRSSKIVDPIGADPCTRQ